MTEKKPQASYYRLLRGTRLMVVTRDRSGENDDGFALVELLVSLAILALALGTTFEAISMGLRNSKKAEQLAKATSLAQSLLARVGTELRLHEGTAQGRFDESFRWEVRASAYGDQADRAAWPVSAYTVDARVIWNEGTREQSFTLTTLRLASKDHP